MGVGWNAAEHASLGLPFLDTATRMALLEEQVEIISRQWSEGEFAFHGRYYQLDGCQAFPKPITRRLVGSRWVGSGALAFSAIAKLRP